MNSRTERQFGRRLAAILCAAGALAFATTAARCDDQKPLGALAETAGAHLNGMSASNGARVYSGDVVETNTAGALHLRLGSGHLLLSASSEASLEQHGKLASVTIEKGSATFSLPDPLQFELETPAGTLRGSGTQTTSGQVEIFGPNQIVVSASKGDLILDNDGELHVILEGRSYRIAIEQDSFETASTERKSKPKHAHRHRKLLFFELAPGGAVADLMPF
ncbi:MAG TPA: hypothetical protein VMF66_10615 [Candidatus Acidoferrum sp.]|nr:hypothetical protein [Candidatus Acidoferrum sp.]